MNIDSAWLHSKLSIRRKAHVRLYMAASIIGGGRNRGNPWKELTQTEDIRNMSVPQRFNENEYINWLKCMNAFLIAKEGLHPYIDTGVNTLHTNVKQNVLSFLSGSNGTIQCKHCSSDNIVYKGATGRNSARWMINCPSNVCDVWLDEILAFHTEPNKGSINWMNSDISKWDTDPYEIAKVFMPKGLNRKTKLPEELDIPAILSLLKYCTYFMKNVPNTRLLTNLIDVRNILYHSGSFKVSDAQKDKWIDMMSQLVLDLNLPVTLHNDLCMLKTEEISIKFEETETKALMNIVTQLQVDIEKVKNKMANMQETQSQLSKQTQNNMDDISDTRMKTDTLEKDLKEMKPILIELTNASDKFFVFLENNDIKDKDLLGAVGSNEKNIIELRSRQFEVEKNILDIKYELSSVKEQVGKNKEETTHLLEELEGTVETNEQEVERFKKEQRKWICGVRIVCSWMTLSFMVGAVTDISFCSTTLKPVLGDGANWMIAALIALTLFGIYCFGMNICIHIICRNKNGSKLRRLLLRYGPLFGFLLHLVIVVCGVKTQQFIYNEAMNGLTEKIKRTYVGVLPAGEPFSDVFNSFQIVNQCCGVKDYTDLHNTTNWNRTSTRTNDTMMIPPSCCEMKPETHQPRSAMCTIDGSESNKDRPCWDHIKREYNNIMEYVMIASNLEAIIFIILLYDDLGIIYDIIRTRRLYCVGNNYQRM